MPITDQLMRAMEMFGKASQEYGIASGIRDATEQAQQLTKETTLDLNQKYGAQKQLANQLQGRLSGLGASGQQIASAVGAIAPADISTVEGARAYAAQAQTPEDRIAANKLVTSNAKALGDANLEMKKPEMAAKNAFDAAEREKDRQLQRDLARTKSADKPGKSLPAAELAKLGNADATITSIQGIRSQLNTMRNEIGPVAGIDITKSWTNPEFGAFKMQVGQMFDKYRIEVTGAGASAGEIKNLKENTPTIKDPPDLFEAKLSRWENTVKSIENKRMERLRKLGYSLGDVGPYDLAATEKGKDPGGFSSVWVSQDGRVFNARTQEEADRLKQLGAKPK